MQTYQGTDFRMDVESAWCALYTRHQHEKAVAEMLSAKGLEVFLPLYSSTRRWKDRKKILSLPLFPCYVFVRGGVKSRLQILTTPGVQMILRNGDHVAVVPEAEIIALQKTVEGRLCAEPHPFLKCGQLVRVRRGSLEGVEGILIRKKNQCRLVLSVDMLAQSVAVEIDAADVDPVIVRGLAGAVLAGQSEYAGIYREGLPHGGRQSAAVRYEHIELNGHCFNQAAGYGPARKVTILDSSTTTGLIDLGRDITL
jgi:transcription antitermination factor NusG